MKKIVLAAFTVFTVFLCACSSSQHEGWVGTYKNNFGTTYELRADSTCTITFEDDNTYEGTWVERDEEGLKYVNIEFAGDPNYYYLKDDVIYRTRQGMMDNSGGKEVKFVD